MIVHRVHPVTRRTRQERPGTGVPCSYAQSRLNNLNGEPKEIFLRSLLRAAILYFALLKGGRVSDAEPSRKERG
jgi:hypothetical protein